jgi:hypothetical protein
MSAILRQLPFREEADELAVGLERIRIKPYQIIVWVSVTTRAVVELPPNTPRIPAILDTGHSDNFSIQDQHLTRWAGLEVTALPQVRRLRDRSRNIPVHAANLWIHRNVPGKRDEFTNEAPWLLPLKQGIAVYPGESQFPRLPLLGLRALVRNKLHLTMDPELCVVNLRTRDWRTKMLRLLS